MRVIWNWLNEFVQFDGTPEELAHALTMNGLEVGTVEAVGGEFDSVRVGEVQEVRPHPGAQQLKLCRVALGDGERRIVCGAPNVAEGQRVPVVLPGCTLPDGKKIEAAQFHGEVSDGMICSASELGFEDSSEGIWVLDPEWQVGASLAEAAGLRDFVLDVEVMPNRGDCLGVLGIAREAACCQRVPLHPSKPRVLEHGSPVNGLAAVSVEAPDLCPRYTARVVEEVTVRPSPIWMQWRLRTAGLRPINNVVDATNYVMLERGQPLHAFDLEKVGESRIVVRKWTPEDGTFTTLEEVERTPPDGACMICDGEGPVAIGGVIGGLASEVKSDTGAILLESAFFQPESIRRTSRALGLSTDASYRFERGVDPAGTPLALDRAAELIRLLSAGRVARGAIDVSPNSFERKLVIFRTPQIKRVLGMELPIREVSDILLSLGMEVTATESQENISIRIPTHRLDICREIDIIEEVARVYGYDRFPTTLPSGGEIPFGPPSEWDFLGRIRAVLSGAGLLEAVNLSFLSEEDVNEAKDSKNEAGALRLRNPLSREGEYLRTDLWPGLLRNAAANMNRSVPDVRLFEVGRVFRPGSPSDSDALPIEELRTASALSQAPGRGLWNEQNRMRDFYDIKGLLELLLSSFGIDSVRYQPGCGYPFHPVRSATVWLQRGGSQEEEKVGELGEIHPDVQRRFDIPQPVMLFEVSADLLQSAAPDAPVFQPLPRFPATSRDLAVVIPREVRTDSLQRAILEAGAPWVREAVLFDVHTGDPIPEGQRSVAFALLYRLDDRTLTGEEVNRVHEGIVARLSQEFGAQLR